VNVTNASRLRFAGLTFAAALVSTAAFAASPIRHPAPAPAAGALAQPVDSNTVGFYSLPPGVRPINSIRRSPMRGARVSFNWRRHGKQQSLIGFNSQIQHVVVIYLENRTPENLFGAFWNAMNPSTGNSFGYDLNLVEPESVNPPTGLYPNALEAPFDPDHSHIPGFVTDVTGKWNLPTTCSTLQKCSSTQYPQYSSLSYVPTPAPGATSRPEVANYISLIENWAYANTVLQSNEGPSYPSHQEAIAGQSGGLPGATIAPHGQDENPAPTSTPYPSQPIPDNAYIGVGSCSTQSGAETVNMTTPYPGTENDKVASCNDYPRIFDYMIQYQKNSAPIDATWQYIAINTNIIWSGPMAVTHLYDQYISGNPITVQQPFAIDPNAYNFAANLQALSGAPGPSPAPVRPFASLTYITACPAESDHPNFSGYSDGPQWLAYVLNAIGESPYWQNTAVVVTWDDWGGFYDNYKNASQWPFHPAHNGNNNPDDPNEWGFRVPLLVISPYVTKRGYVSTTQRSQGAILNFVEEVFSLPANALHGDDQANLSDDLGDMFNFSNTPLPWVPLPTTFTPPPALPTSCPHG
jgi:phospholipase C